MVHFSSLLLDLSPTEKLPWTTFVTVSFMHEVPRYLVKQDSGCVYEGGFE